MRPFSTPNSHSLSASRSRILTPQECARNSPLGARSQARIKLRRSHQQAALMLTQRRKDCKVLSIPLCPFAPLREQFYFSLMKFVLLTMFLLACASGATNAQSCLTPDDVRQMLARVETPA